MGDECPRIPEYQAPGWLESFLESALPGANIGASALPVIGPFISTLIGRKITELQDKRIRACFEELGRYLKTLPQSISQSEVFCDAVNVTVKNCLNAPSEKKRKFAEYLNRSFLENLSSAKGEEQKGCRNCFDTFFEFSALFDQLSLPALECLIAFRKDFPKAGATRFEIIDKFGHISPLFGKRAFLELENNGLLLEKGSKEQPPSFDPSPKMETDLGRKIYVLEPLGALFSDWLQAQREGGE